MIKSVFFTVAICLLLLSCNVQKHLNHHQNKIRPKPPLMGWVSWNNYRVQINEDIINSQADATADLSLPEYDYTCINIDEAFYRYTGDLPL